MRVDKQSTEICEENIDSGIFSKYRQKLRDILKETDAASRFDTQVKLHWALRILFACIGGSLVFLSFPTYDFYPFAYFALVFHLWAIHGTKPKEAFALGLLAGTITNVGGFYWISDLLIDFGHMSSWLASTICVLLCITQGFVFSFWTYLIRKIDITPWKSGILAFLALEFIIPMLFPWYYGNSQYLFSPATQIAEIFGVLGISLLLLCVNFLLYEISKIVVAKFIGQSYKASSALLLISSIYIAYCFIFGLVRIGQIDEIQAAAPKLHVGMVEADIGIWEKEDASKLRNNLFIHHKLSQELADKGVELIVWPESSYQSNYIWGSNSESQDLAELEADALYTDEFANHAKLIMHSLDHAFGREFRTSREVNASYHRALMQSGIKNKYTAATSQYPIRCTDQPRVMLKCPYSRVVPDQLTYYLPSYDRLRGSREADISERTMPYNMLGVQRDHQAAVLFGTLSMEGKPEYNLDYKALLKAPRDQLKVYNTAILLDKDGKVLGNYHKVYLLLFGEYIPFIEQFPWIYEVLPEAGSLSKGIHTNLIEFKGHKIAVIICYEDILPRFVRDFSKERPQVFVNITNDAWFGKTSEPYLHMALATIRSIEHRKWMVRSTNTGVSVFVDAVGRIVSQSSIYEPEILDAKVAIMPDSRTVYSYIGDVLGWFSLVTSAVYLLIASPKVKRKKKEERAQKLSLRGEGSPSQKLPSFLRLLFVNFVQRFGF